MTTARAAIAELLEQRGADKTICPSEAARALAGSKGDWRAHMGDVHDTVDILLAERIISLSWQGEPMIRRTGAYRIANGAQQ